MTPEHEPPFDESLLSGYLDGALTQGDEQRVKLHLEDCSECRAAVDEMKQLKEATMQTRFSVPSDTQWDERPRGGASRLSFGVGWVLLIAWAVGVAGFALGQLWAESQTTLTEKLVIFSGLTGVTLVFLSVLIDRLKARATDRYRRVDK